MLLFAVLEDVRKVQVYSSLACPSVHALKSCTRDDYSVTHIDAMGMHGAMVFVYYYRQSFGFGWVAMLNSQN